MRKPVYPYRKCGEHSYEFVSIGEKHITKNVEFTPTEMEGIVSLGFADLLENGALDDKANSNNGDTAKVMATVINIIENYTLANPPVKIFFHGSTPQRTRLYGRILKNYYHEFARNFVISGLVEETFEEVVFDPANPYIYNVYFIQRIS